MPQPERASLPVLSSIPQGCSLQKSALGQRFTCVREGEQIHVLADRCPHQGYPLSQGVAKDGVLTCNWHNWKFAVASGACEFGGEGVRRYPSHVADDGHVIVDLRVDVAKEGARLRGSMRRALVDGDADAFVRDGLRLGALDPSEPGDPGLHSGLTGLNPGFGVLAQLGAQRAPYGFDHPLATLSDISDWVERGWLESAPALSVAATLFAEGHANLDDRPPEAETETKTEATDGWASLGEDLRAQRRGPAEAKARAAGEQGSLDALYRGGLLPYIGDHLLAYGHGAIYATKALALAERFPEHRGPLMAALAVQLSWATRETSLPPWGRTRAGYEAADALSPGDAPLGEARPAYERAVLKDEASAVTATIEALARGVDPAALIAASAHAAAVRITRFDPSWETRLDAEVSILGLTHTLTFAEAALSLLRWASPKVAARLAVQAAAFVAKIHRADRPTPEHESRQQPLVQPPLQQPLVWALARREGADARLARALSPSQRLDAYAQLAPFAAYEAFVRPIFTAHAIKLTEAAHRLERSDPTPDHAYLEAVLTLLLPRRPERSPVRAANLAARVLDEGKPPKSLY